MPVSEARKLDLTQFQLQHELPDDPIVVVQGVSPRQRQGATVQVLDIRLEPRQVLMMHAVQIRERRDADPQQVGASVLLIHVQEPMAVEVRTAVYALRSV